MKKLIMFFLYQKDRGIDRGRSRKSMTYPMKRRGEERIGGVVCRTDFADEAP